MNKIIQDIGDNMLSIVLNEGSVKAGHNGPYNCEDTSVRNNSHWIVIYKYLFLLTHDEKYLSAIRNLAEELLNSRYDSKSGAILCMKDHKMDHLNGSIGQAWAIEGLVAAFEVLNDVKYYDKAVSIFLSQSYDFHEHLWTRIELDGTDIGFDRVFNHQLWFAASGFLLCKLKNHSFIEKQLQDFMTHISSLFDIYPDGLMKHYIVGMEELPQISWKSKLKHGLRFLAYFDPRFDCRYFEKGYHLFDLYGFALIYLCRSDFNVFKESKFQKALLYGLNIQKLNDDFHVDRFLTERKPIFFQYNKYSYSYNSPAFEFPLIDFVFNDGKNSHLYNVLFTKQLKMTYDSSVKKFTRNNSDPETLTARIYELTRYLELVMKYEKK